MSSPFARVLPYVKASVDAHDASCFKLSAEESPVLEPFIGRLYVSYVVDEGTHLRLVLMTVAPSRDVLAVSSPQGVDELQAVTERVWPNGDHLLTRYVYRRTKGRWNIHLAS